ncbi:hypothetical protein LPJ66_004273 [Kickxella alabastrina]|uniref:Uncharacterized protein n=1 Tax=Kickxella alabastrina TaxID=61397 RepID=A0ACC1ILR5_9FUNG|nr:hypothetical protein LPJ66_004273 [Kickxella alabastrina]
MFLLRVPFSMFKQAAVCQQRLFSASMFVGKDSPLGQLESLAKLLSDDARKSPKPDATSEEAVPTMPMLPEFPLDMAAISECESESDAPTITNKPQPSSSLSSASAAAAAALIKTIDRPQPAIRRGWSREEKARLVRVVELYRKKRHGTSVWPRVQHHFPDRTSVACRDAYQKILKLNAQEGLAPNDVSPSHRLTIDKGSRRRQTSSELEIAALTEAVRKYGEHSWTAVAREMERTTGIARLKGVYSNLWNMKVCPKALSAPPWSIGKSERLKQLAEEHGRDEVFLTYKFFPEYTPPVIKTMLNRIGTDREALDYRSRKPTVHKHTFEKK